MATEEVKARYGEIRKIRKAILTRVEKAKSKARNWFGSKPGLYSPTREEFERFIRPPLSYFKNRPGDSDPCTLMLPDDPEYDVDHAHVFWYRGMYCTPSEGVDGAGQHYWMIEDNGEPAKLSDAYTNMTAVKAAIDKFLTDHPDWSRPADWPPSEENTLPLTHWS